MKTSTVVSRPLIVKKEEDKYRKKTGKSSDLRKGRGKSCLDE
ncbi:MAG: hypothetical protein QXQ39_07550 [Conexivisphaerales archaeon]